MMIFNSVTWIKNKNKLCRTFGFSLIELLVAMTVGMGIIASLVSFFIYYQNTAADLTTRSEILADTVLTTKIMSSIIKQTASAPVGPIIGDLNSRGVPLPQNYPTNDSVFSCLPYYDKKSKTLTYQNINGSVGIFQYQRNGEKDKLYWLSSDASTYEELVRNLDPVSGFVTTPGCISVDTPITITSVYGDVLAPEKISMSFLLYPRN